MSNISEALKNRLEEPYLLDTRNGRIDTFGDWKRRIDAARTLASGNFTVREDRKSVV